ncbi:MAG: type II CRISPR-associated endonuclease Cas1 [Mycoplasma sp.]|nr:type II CRISPR-associated endonuclease Cas1 [Mycoplasma sp.]
MGFKSLEIVEGEILKTYLNNLLIYRNETKIIIPISTIDTLIIDNYSVNISTQLLNKLSENNILIIICDKKHLPSSQIIPINGNYNSLKIIQSQIRWTNKSKGLLWQQIITKKIQNQINLLTYLKIATEDLEKLKNEINFYDISNREGHASKIYWHKLFGKNFNRDDDNAINSLLNYGYAILLGYLSRSIVKKGLDNRISIFHKSFNNYFALACDLMEPFRPMVDYIVHKLYLENNCLILTALKDEIIKLFTKKIMINDQYEYFNNAIDKTIDSVIKNMSVPNIKIEYDKF